MSRKSKYAATPRQVRTLVELIRDVEDYIPNFTDGSSDRIFDRIYRARMMFEDEGKEHRVQAARPRR